MNFFWNSPLHETVKSTERYVRIERRRNHLSQWLSAYQAESPTSSNQGTEGVAFQKWFRFKEAYSPKFVTDTLASLPYAVERCLDPFGGSGTTALTCRMLGINSVTTEVNPFLADLIQVKLTPIKAVEFEESVARILKRLRVSKHDLSVPEGFPSTITEPGTKGRYIFPLDVYSTVRAIVRKSEEVEVAHRRLVRVLLGSVLIENSNVRINGKGRRYRSNWEKRQSCREKLLKDFRIAVADAVKDLNQFSKVPNGNHRVIVGDARKTLSRVKSADMAIFSPPYPNSFDYTDVYNVELWMLGYLSGNNDNRQLRQSTFRSHVQTKWSPLSGTSIKSTRLNRVVKRLNKSLDQLWDRNIPSMIQMYFEDLFSIFSHLQRILPIGHHAVVAIGDSQYAGILIDVSEILPEVAFHAGFVVSNMGEIRSMRNSSQHGGNFNLSEHCIVLERRI